MASDASETIADIVKELRRQSANEQALSTQLRKTDDDVDFAIASCYAEDAKYLSQMADRIEAAWKRERAEVEANALSVGGVLGAMRKPVGNAAALREALEKCRALAETIWQSEGGEDVSAEIAELKDRINAALAKPPRQCDVGTADEQEKRFGKFCDSHKRVDGSTVCSPRCPLYKTPECSLHWAQMPYEEGGAK